MIIYIHKKCTLQLMATNKQQSPNLGMPAESNKKLIWQIINYAFDCVMSNIFAVMDINVSARL